jgi:hypothetical protein
VQLLVVVLHSEELLDEVLSTLVEAECPDAVVVESRSGLELLERDLPIFAGLRSLVPSGIDFSSLVLCVIEDQELVSDALEAISALGAERDHGGGAANTAFVVPVAEVRHF